MKVKCRKDNAIMMNLLIETTKKQAVRLQQIEQAALTRYYFRVSRILFDINSEYAE